MVPGPEGFRYFLIFSLLLHSVFIWTFFFLAPRMGWLRAGFVEPKVPEYVQIVELPPEYEAPKTKLQHPTRPRRYADRRSVVKEEKIPGGRDMTIRPRQ